MKTTGLVVKVALGDVLCFSIKLIFEKNHLLKLQLYFFLAL